MNHWICETCGTQHAATPEPPEVCAICADERQYVGWQGQRWTTLEALARDHVQRIEEQQGLLALGMTPAFAIDQRALLLPTDAGNLLWEALPLVTPEAVEALVARGGVDRILVSHPHFYASMVAWSEALGDVPILLHAADRGSLQRPDPRIELWSGDVLRLFEDVTLVRCGGHFPGSTALHWRRPGTGGVVDVSDAEAVGTLAGGLDVVVDATRPVPEDPARSAATTQGVLDGVRRAGTRLLVSGGAAVLEGPRGRVLDDPELLDPAWRDIARASARQYEQVAAETVVDWAYLCPPLALAPGRRIGRYRRGDHQLLVDAEGRSAISVEDLAVALLDEAEHPLVHRDCSTVSRAP